MNDDMMDPAQWVALAVDKTKRKRATIAGIERVVGFLVDVCTLDLNQRQAANANWYSPVLFLMHAQITLALGRAWLGKLLGGLGEVNPYPLSMDSESPVIEANAYDVESFAVPGDPVAAIKFLRGLIENTLATPPANFSNAPGLAATWQNAYVRLVESKMLLGEALGCFYVADTAETDATPAVAEDTPVVEDAPVAAESAAS